MKIAGLAILYLCVCACASVSASSYRLTVETDKPFYYRGENVLIRGRLTYNDWPVQQQSVTVVVWNPGGMTIFYRSNETGSDGSYSLRFTLSNQTELGTYTVRVNHFEAGANYTTFIVKSIPGDVNDDGKVDLTDVYLVATAYGSCPGDPNWDPRCDLNGDSKVGLIDYYTVTRNYGRTGP